MFAQRVGVKNKAFHDLRCNDEEAFRNSIDRRSAAALEDEKFPGHIKVKKLYEISDRTNR